MRLASRTLGVTTHYASNGQLPLIIRSGNKTTTVLYGLSPVAEKTSEWNYVLNDGFNLPRQLTDTGGVSHAVCAIQSLGQTDRNEWHWQFRRQLHRHIDRCNHRVDLRWQWTVLRSGDGTIPDKRSVPQQCQSVCAVESDWLYLWTSEPGIDLLLAQERKALTLDRDDLPGAYLVGMYSLLANPTRPKQSANNAAWRRIRWRRGDHYSAAHTYTTANRTANRASAVL